MLHRAPFLSRLPACRHATLLSSSHARHIAAELARGASYSQLKVSDHGRLDCIYSSLDTLSPQLGIADDQHLNSSSSSNTAPQAFSSEASNSHSLLRSVTSTSTVEAQSAGLGLPNVPSQSTLSAETSASNPSPPSALSFLSSDEKSHIDETFLTCSEPGEKLRVGVLLSGGVDSSVALRLLLAAGHSCTAFYLKIWFQEDFENFWSSCPWEEDLKYAHAVCDEAGVELQVVQLTDHYWKHVVAHMIEEYKAGRTPNPDVLCNSRIKFGVFLEHVKDMGFDRIASGHYARVVRVNKDSGEVHSILQLSADKVKDQTYFLSHLSQSQLSKLIFPLGCISKDEVRKIAEWLGLPNKHRKDSQGICFLGKVKFSDFIARHLGEQEGRILEAETGNYLGNHRGYWFYTIGQRQGLRLSHGPWYVVDKDQANNVVFVSKEYFSPEKKRREFEVHALNWFNHELPKDLSNLQCKVRHGPGFYDCSLHFQDLDSAFVQLSKDDQGIAAGQYAAFYKENVCLGSGVITEFRNDRSSAVSIKALELAKMSSLPVNSLSKSKRKKLASLQKAKAETGKEEKIRSPRVFEWFPNFQTMMKKFVIWIRGE